MEIKNKREKLERFSLEEECKINHLLFRKKTNLYDIYMCGASINITQIKCQKFCQHLGMRYISTESKAEPTASFYLCNYVPKKNNGQG